MDWTQFVLLLISLIGIFLANAGLIIWMRSESRSDWRHMDNKVDAMKELIVAIQQEMKDFHGRLCTIEEKRK